MPFASGYCVLTAAMHSSTVYIPGICTSPKCGSTCPLYWQSSSEISFFLVYQKFTYDSAIWVIFLTLSEDFETLIQPL